MQPPPAGWPDATNTGVPAGTALTSSGSLTVTADNTVIDAKDIIGTVDIRANNVTIENSKIEAGTNGWGIYIDSGSVTVKHSEITGSDYGGIAGGPYTLDADNIHDFHGDGMKLHSNVTVENSWIHDAKPENGQHADGMQLQDALSDVTIRHNTITPGTSTGDGVNSAVFIKDDLGPGNGPGPVVVDDNLLGGGGYTLYVYKGSTGLVQGGVTVTNNRFLRDAEYGPVAVNIPVDSWSGNVYDDDGAAVAK